MKSLNVQQAYTVLKLTEQPHSAAPLSHQAEDYLGQAPMLVLDLAGIHLNSMLIGELLNLHKAFARHWRHDGARLALVNLTPLSRSVLEQVKLDGLFALCDSLDEALAAC